MKFITNLFKDKMIFYLAFVLAIVIVIYKLFNYKEGITQDNISNCNMKKKNGLFIQCWLLRMEL